MYFPILRGKQFELIALRELAKLNLNDVFCPVIEPVKRYSKPLERTIRELNENDVTPQIIINSELGETEHYSNLYQQLVESEARFEPCVLFDQHTSAESVEEVINSLEGKKFSLFLKTLDEEKILDFVDKCECLFIESNIDVAENVARQLQKKVVLIEDGFLKQTRNADYPSRSSFSSAISHYGSSPIFGFGDYTITGSAYIESGGPAYVVAIHLSQILQAKSIFASGVQIVVNHFCSQDNGSYDDPAGKFLEALSKLHHFLESEGEAITNTIAVKEFKHLYNESHFPGLGGVKKLSILHHIETISTFLKGVD